MCDSKEIKLLEPDIERVSVMKHPVTDLENNVRDMKMVLENNNDAMVANLEERHDCDRNDGIIIHHPDEIVLNNLERKPPETVVFGDKSHGIIRGRF